MLRSLCVLALLLPLAPASGCGSQADPVRVGVLEIKDSFTNDGSSELVESGLQQLTSELAVSAGLAVSGSAGLSRDVQALAEEGDDFILITGRGDQALDAAATSTGIPLAGLGMNLEDAAGNRLTATEGVTYVRYMVEEGAYLSGVLAAGMTVTRGHPWLNPEAVVCFIGCPQDPFNAAYLKGFEEGVAAINPKCAIAAYEVPDNRDAENAQAIVGEALKFKADIFFCVPGAFSREVLALGGARGFLVITSDADGSETGPDYLLASTVLRDDLAMFKATREFLRESLPSGLVEWGQREGIVDFSVNMKLYGYVPASVDQSLKQPVPDNLYTP